jgi:hypothetical protein
MGCITEDRSAITKMIDAAAIGDNYPLEVSGPGVNDTFLVERTSLRWTKVGDQRLLLHYAGPERVAIFVRFIASEVSFTSVLAASPVESVQPVNSIGLSEMRVLWLRSQSRAHARREIASSFAKYSSKGQEPKMGSFHTELEEVLREA